MSDAVQACGYLISVVFTVLQYFLWCIFGYNFVISIFGWYKRKEEPADRFPASNRFAVIIAAHNEEKVIGGAVRSLKKVNYPDHMYDIFVIADNCTDKTAETARQNGACVFERIDEARKGKGYSLEWMFGRLFEMETGYDAICILDADNLVSSNFLIEMNKRLCLGHEVIQGYLDSKNPNDTWVSGNYSISYWISNRLFQLPRHYLGLNCQLGGTGFVMRTDILRQLGWGSTCLTEDLEFSIRLVLNGSRVSWSHEAIVYDEKPLLLSQSWMQRKRWMQGHCDCAGRYLKKLTVKAVKDGDKVAMDLILYLIQPFIIVMNGFGMLYAFIQFVTILLLSHDIIDTMGLPAILTFIFYIAAAYINIIFVYIEGKLTARTLRYFMIFPLYSLTWIPVIIQGFHERNKREWFHTTHSRSLDIQEVEGAEELG